MYASSADEASGPKRRLHCPLDAVLLFAPLLSGLPRERVLVAYLGDGDALIHVATVAEGSDAAALLPSVAILRDALLLDARGIVVAHNHPSGDATPSLADVGATRGLATGAAAIGLRLIDHVVLADGQACSFRAMGLL